MAGNGGKLKDGGIHYFKRGETMLFSKIKALYFLSSTLSKAVVLNSSILLVIGVLITSILIHTKA